ncbi:MAG: Small Arf-related GTPase [Promethearchaeota archaeon]|nr:MAG: Small Arf-related GTPase [Candidatus Lokiarchaeota archaeon]
MEDAIKVIVSGLHNAGKTSILTALDKKYDFRDEILELKPTIRVEYKKTSFLGREAIFWDMGGQEKYREMYLSNADIYFSETDLLLYVMDIQDQEKFQASLDYFDSIVSYFKKNDMDIPIIISFHKYDPEVRTYEEINEDILYLREKIKEEHPSFNILFQQTSIYDVISIVQLISYGLSIFDEKFFELSLLMEKSLGEFNCTSLILFDKNGIIISEFYSEDIDPGIYVYLLEAIKEHLFLLKRIQEENYEHNKNFLTIENELVSYLHGIDIHDESFFISALLQERFKEPFLTQFPEFLGEIKDILNALLE